MRAILITILGLCILNIGRRAYFLNGSYPRQLSIGRVEDSIELVLQVGLLVWVINLLLNLP